MDYPVYTECGECIGWGTESHKELVNHILTNHTGYSIEEAEEFARAWEEDAAAQQEANDIYRANYFRRYGVDPEKIDEDPL